MLKMPPLKLTFLLLCALGTLAHLVVNAANANVKQPFDGPLKKLLETGLNATVKCVSTDKYHKEVESFFKLFLSKFKLSDLVDVSAKRNEELTKAYAEASKEAVKNTDYEEEMAKMVKCISVGPFIQQSLNLQYGMDVGNYSTITDECVKKLTTPCNREEMETIKAIFDVTSTCLIDIKGDLNKIYKAILPNKAPVVKVKQHFKGRLKKLLETGLNATVKCVSTDKYHKEVESFFKLFLSKFKLSDLVDVSAKRNEELTKAYAEASKEAVKNTDYEKEMAKMVKCISVGPFIQQSLNLQYGLDVGNYSTVTDKCVKKLTTRFNEKKMETIKAIFDVTSTCLIDIKSDLNKIYKATLPKKTC